MARPAVCEKRSFLATCALLVMSRACRKRWTYLAPACEAYALMPSSRRRGSGPGKSFPSRPFFTWESADAERGGSPLQLQCRCDAGVRELQGNPRGDGA